MLIGFLKVASLSRRVGGGSEACSVRLFKIVCFYFLLMQILLLGYCRVSWRERNLQVTFRLYKKVNFLYMRGNKFVLICFEHSRHLLQEQRTKL